jgi:tetratricopeptide (TPR) repeat protein
MMGYGMVTASLLAAANKRMESGLRRDQQIQMLSFTTRWGSMHPLEAIERYQQELAETPDNPDLHVGIANIFRFLGKSEEAMAGYERALELDPEEIEAWVGKAQMAGERRDLDESIRCWEKVREIAIRKGAISAQYLEFLAAAEENLDLLRRGIFPENAPPILDASDSKTPTQSRPAPASRVKVGRNDPCPCGSGKKYKHCHGRKS